MKQTSKMMEAFIEQTYGSIENVTNKDSEANQRESAEKTLHQENMSKAMLQLAQSQNIADHMDIPTSNPNLSNDNSKYKKFETDHSLDMVRLKGKIKHIDDGVEWGDLHDDSVGNWSIN